MSQAVPAPVDDISLPDLPDPEDLRMHVTALEGRRRQIEAEIGIPCDREVVWRVLSDYENLANFIPNLA
ncbi:MAG: hypothetical protein Q6J68_07630, partial [Thermostichales cyanobacterium SZTDM-1c_bins_54]